MSQTQVPKTTIYGPKGTLNVNETDVAKWLADGYSTDPANSGKRAGGTPPKLGFVKQDGDWKTSGAAPGQPRFAWEKAGDIAFEQAISDGKSEPDAAKIAIAAASKASKPGDPYFAEQPVGWLEGDDAKLAKVGAERELWQIAGDDAFKAALDDGKSIKQAGNAAYKAAKAVDGSPLK